MAKSASKVLGSRQRSLVIAEQATEDVSGATVYIHITLKRVDKIREPCKRHS